MKVSYSLCGTATRKWEIGVGQEEEGRPNIYEIAQPPHMKQIYVVLHDPA